MVLPPQKTLHRDHPPDPGDRRRRSPGPWTSPGRSTSSSSPRTTRSRSSSATCGPRARSRSSPRWPGSNFIELAVKAMMGEPVRNRKTTLDLNYVGVKAPQFSFSRLKGADPILGVEMASTGEVACLGDDIHEAFLKALLSAGLQPARKEHPAQHRRRDLQAQLPRAGPASSTTWGFASTRPSTPRSSSGRTASPTPASTRSTRRRSRTSGTIIARRKIDFVISIPNPEKKVEFDSDYRLRRPGGGFLHPHPDQSPGRGPLRPGHRLEENRGPQDQALAGI